eukprot:Phypoly_transcript_07794.p1 GENE.Phypoly_transcript_07794~~Phypoly_transcript_07794.p1  ORF type:complete len:474 (+),score=106.91 Phypoly_transcript_07794:116-1537(+)
MAAYVNELLKLLVRAFHGPECGIVLDALLRANRSIKDDELAATLKLQQKQVRKVLFDLRTEHIVACENRNKEALKQGERSTAHLHWFIDYKNAIDCVKYKIHHLTKKFNEEKNRELQVQTYVCKQCKNSYSSLDAYTLQENGWKCEHCYGELEEVSAAESISKTQNQVKTLWTQLKPITDALKRVEAHPIPKFPKTSAAAMLAGLDDTSMLISTAPTTVTGGGLGLGGTGGGHGGGGGGHARASSASAMTGGQLDVFVDIVGSSQNGTTSTSQNGAAKAAPKANIPWMQSQSAPQTSTTTVQAAEPTTSTNEEMDKETYEQYVKQYMEEYQKQQQLEMAKQQKLQQQQQQSPQSQLAGQKHKSNGHLVKEEPAGLDAAQADRKRPKVEGDGAGVGGVAQEVKVEPKREQEEATSTAEFEGEEAAAPAGEEPMVRIGTQQFPISQITEDQHGLMTPEEYEAYYKVYMSYYFQNQ